MSHPDNKKRVLMVVISELCKAGLPSVVMSIVRTLSNYYTFDLLTLSEESGYYDSEFLSYGGHLYTMDILSFNQKRLFSPVRGMQLKKKLNLILRKERYEVVHCHIGIEAGIVLKTAKKWGIPIRIAHAHGLYVNSGKNVIRRLYFSLCLKYISDYSTNRLACSSEAGQTLFGRKDFMNVLNPINTDYYTRIVHKGHKGIRLLQIGYYSKDKNQLFSIELIKELHKQGDNACLSFVGFVTDKDYYNKMLRKIEEYDLSDSIIFYPFDANQANLLATADFVLLPSTTEGLPIVALESQVAGIPCLISDRVPRDADLGMARFIEHDHIDEWIQCIRMGQEGLALNNDKAARISEKEYGKIILTAYQWKDS